MFKKKKKIKLEKVHNKNSRKGSLLSGLFRKLSPRNIDKDKENPDKTSASSSSVERGDLDCNGPTSRISTHSQEFALDGCLSQSTKVAHGTDSRVRGTSRGEMTGLEDQDDNSTEEDENEESDDAEEETNNSNAQPKNSKTRKVMNKKPKRNRKNKNNNENELQSTRVFFSRDESNPNMMGSILICGKQEGNNSGEEASTWNLPELNHTTNNNTTATNNNANINHSNHSNNNNITPSSYNSVRQKAEEENVVNQQEKASKHNNKPSEFFSWRWLAIGALTVGSCMAFYFRKDIEVSLSRLFQK